MSWESEAANWIAWARAPGHDAYWYYRDSFFDEILPPAGRATLDLGCGEGRVARDLKERGHHVTGVVSAPSLVGAAQPAGRFCKCVTHPFLDAGEWESPDADASFIVAGSYLGKREFEGTFERNGLQVTFRGWCYALADYARALEDAGFLIERLREPTHTLEDPRHDRIPLFLHLRAVKPA